MSIIKARSAPVVIRILVLMLGMVFLAAGPGDGPGDGPEAGPKDWSTGSITAKHHDFGPTCYGHSRDAGVNPYYPIIYGSSFMACTLPATQQNMWVELIRCDNWILFFCTSTSIEEHLDDGTHSGPGQWKLPTSGVYYVSDVLEEGWYRTTTRHTVFWPGGQDVAHSASAWIRVETD